MQQGGPRLSGWLGPKKFPDNQNPDNFCAAIPRIEIPIIIQELLL